MSGKSEGNIVPGKSNWWWKPNFKNALLPNENVRMRGNQIRVFERVAWCYEAEARLVGQYRFQKPFVLLSKQEIYECVGIWSCPPGMKQALDLPNANRNDGAQQYTHPFDWMSPSQIKSYNKVGSDRLTRDREPAAFWSNEAATLPWRNALIDLTVGDKKIKKALIVLLEGHGKKRRMSKPLSSLIVIPKANKNERRYLRICINSEFAAGAIFDSLVAIFKEERERRNIVHSNSGLGPGGNSRSGEAWKDIEAFDCWLSKDKVMPESKIIDGDFTESAYAELHERKERMVWKYFRWTPSTFILDELDEKLENLLHGSS